MSDIQDDPDFNLTVEQWLKSEMTRMFEELYILEMMYDSHELLWGVPCGPTLTMVYPVEPVGLLGIPNYGVSYTTEEEKAIWKRVADALDNALGDDE